MFFKQFTREVIGNETGELFSFFVLEEGNLIFSYTRISFDSEYLCTPSNADKIDG